MKTNTAAAIPKSASLIASDKAQRSFLDLGPQASGHVRVSRAGVQQILPVHCLNEFVAILPFTIKTEIAMPNGQYETEGIVIGVGPGVADNGTRCPSQLQLGDVVAYSQKHVALEMNPDNGFYKNHKILILSEKSLMCKLPPVKFELINATV